MEPIQTSKSINHENLASDCVSHTDGPATNNNKISGSNNNSSSNVPALKFASNHHAIATANGQQPHHQLMSANSFELNGMTTSSLSEDSGLPPTTNSSISSGDSSRFGLCKSAFELIESDGEVSQFDSLDTFSDGGMSTENFNTLKKVRLAPIDPPPEFQDSPQTTLLRSPAIQSFSLQLSQHILSKAMTICSSISSTSNVPTPILTHTKSLEFHEKTCANCIYDSVANNDEYIFQPTERHPFNNYFQEYSNHHIYDIYASDSMLKRHIDNIYDLPCDESTNVGTSIDSLTEPSVKVIQCHSPESFDRRTAVQSKSARERQHQNQMKMERASEIHDYDLYYRNRRKPHDDASLKSFSFTSSFNDADAVANATKNTKTFAPLQRNVIGPFNANTNASTTSSSTTTSTTTLQRRKNPSILYSPLHYHASSNLSTGNRPNSRNSLNSRLSSSHNSLTIATSNKADDSIFITQAMSHDALTGREISDFYNVPIDSDIYALPIDVIRPKSVASCGGGGGSGIAHLKCTSDISTKPKTSSMKTINSHGLAPKHNNNATTPSLSLLKSNKAIHGRLKYVRNNKRRKNLQQNNGGNTDQTTGASSNGLARTNDKRNSVSDNVAEPKHMMLDEVKRFYTNLYTNSASHANGNVGARSKDIAAACGDDRIANSNIINNNSANKCAQSINESDRNNNGNSNGTSGGTINTNNIINNSNSCTSNNSIIISGSNGSTNNNNNILINNNIINSTSKNGSSNLNNFNNYHSNNNNNNCELAASSATVTTPSSSTPNYSNANNNKTANNVSKSSNLRTNANKYSANNSKTSSSSTGPGGVVTKENEYISTSGTGGNVTSPLPSTKKSQFSINLNLKQKFCSIFRFRKSYHHQNNGSNQRNSVADVYDSNADHASAISDKKVKFSTRALPPLPPKDMTSAGADSPTVKEDQQDEKSPDPMDFAANIEKVKEYGWYWGPISSEAAEKILSNEPDGSFIVRDSSDDHYIFSLTFKLNNTVRHVRIEQDQGTFSFGSCAKFKSRTIMEFIENAVESSRSGRYLFFFHRRPEHGPMRVQLTNPVSRFKHIQSLQHMCRFVIRRAVVRKDLIQTLPLPRRLLDYLSYKNCYSELVESDSSQSPTSEVQTTIANGTEADDETPIINR